MARLRQITAAGVDGLKGQRFEQTLTGCDLFAGPNGAGKSTRLAAVSIAARGLAESPTDPVREYLGPTRPRAEVTLTFDGGASLTRDLSASSTSTAGKRTTFQGEALLGPHVARWDLADMARMTDADRAKLLERICAAAGAGSAWTLARVDAALRSEMGIAKNAALPGAHPLSVALAGWSAGKSVGAWLAEQTKALDEAFTTANAAQKRAEQDATNAGAKLTDDAPAGTLAEKRAELERTRTRGEAVKAQIAAAAATGSRARELDQDRTRASVAVDAAERALEQAEQAERAARGAKPSDVEVRRAEQALQEATRAVQSDDGQAAAAVEAARTRFNAARAQQYEAAARLDRATEAMQRAAAALATAQGQVTALQSLVAGASGACRHCQGEDPLGLVAALATAEAHAGQLADDAEAAVDVRMRRQTVHLAAVENATVAATALQTAERDLRTFEAGQAAALRAESEARAALTRAHQAQAGETTRLAAAAQRAEADVAAARTALEQARQTLAEVEARTAVPVESPAVGDLDTLTAQRDALAADYRRLTGEIDTLTRHEERQRMHQEAIAAREAAAERFRLVKALRAALASLRAAVAASAYGPIQDAANAVLARAELDMRVVFRDESDFGAEVAQRDGSRPYVAFWALSDAQRAEFAVALAVALAQLTKAPWRGVLVDGLERIERRPLHGLLVAIGAMVTEGALDNFLGAFVASREGEVPFPEGVAVHWLGGAADAVRGAA